MTTTPTAGRYRWLITFGLFCFLAVNFADKAVMGLAAEPIMREMQLSHGDFGRIAGSFFILFSIAGLVGGMLANRIRTRWLLAGMAAIWAVSQIPLLLVATPATLLLSRVVLGAAEGPAYPVAMHALYKWFHNSERALPSTLLTMGGAIGTGVVAPAVIWVIVHQGWRTAFLVVAIASALWAVLWVMFGKDGPLDADPSARSAADEALPEHVPFWRLATARTSLGCFIGGFSAYVILTIATIWLPSYLERAAGYSMSEVGPIVAIPATTQIFMMPFLGWLSQRLHRRGVSSRMSRGVLGAGLIAAAGVAMMAMSHLQAGPMLILLVTLAFSLPNFAFVTGVMMISEISPARQRGGMLGMTNCIATLAGLVTPMIIGHIIDLSPDKIEGYRSGFMLAGAFALAGGIVSAFLVHPAADRARFARQAASNLLRPALR